MAKRSNNGGKTSSDSDLTASAKAKPPTSSKPFHLTPSEIESLRQDKRRASDLARELIAADKAKSSK
jgi:hypothetical protein